MKTLFLLGLVLLAPLWFVTDDGDERGWLADLDEAHALAVKSGKPLLVGFR